MRGREDAREGGRVERNERGTVASSSSASSRRSRDQRSSLLVVKSVKSALSRLPGQNESLEKEEGREDSESESRPVNEGVAPLVLEDGPKGPGDDGGSSDVSLVGLESVSDSSCLKEEQSEEHENLGADSGVVVSLSSKGLESRKDDEDQSPSVIEGKGKVDEELIGEVSTSVVPLDLDVYGGDGGRDQNRGDEGEDVVLSNSEPGVSGGEETEQSESPLDLVNDESLSGLGELVDDEAEEQEMDQREDVEGVGGRSKIGLLPEGSRERVDVRTETGKEDKDVDDLEDDSVCDSHVERKSVKVLR